MGNQLIDLDTIWDDPEEAPAFEEFMKKCEEEKKEEPEDSYDPFDEYMTPEQQQEMKRYFQSSKPFEETDIVKSEEQHITKTYNVPILNSDELVKARNTLVHFLSAVHPWLFREKFNLYAVEIRPVSRDKDGGLFHRPLHLWHIDKQSIEYLDKFLNVINGKPYCLYWGIRPCNVKKINSKSGCMDANSVTVSQNIVLDFDHCLSVDFTTYMDRLQQIGIVPTVSIFSGHGYQVTIHLNDTLESEEPIRDVLKLFYIKGFPVDLVVFDKPRVMRTPGMWNCKNWKEGKIVRTELISITKTKYYISDIIQRLSALPDVQTLPEQQKDKQLYINIVQTIQKPTEPIHPVQRPVQIVQAPIDVVRLAQRYDFVNVSLFPQPVQRMLSNTRDGFKNKVLMFLIPYFKNSLGYSKDVIIQIMEEWAKTAEGESLNMSKEVSRIYKYNYNKKTGVYTSELAAEFGYLDFMKKENVIRIPQTFLHDYNKITDGAVRIYLAMLLDMHLTSNVEYTYKDVAEVANVTVLTVKRSIQSLVDVGFVDKIKRNRKKSEVYILRVNLYKLNTATDQGFVLLDTSLLNQMLFDSRRPLTATEMKVYVLLSVLNGIGATIYPTRQYIADKICKTPSAVTKITNSLSKKRYISKNTLWHGKIPKCIYRLNF